MITRRQLFVLGGATAVAATSVAVLVRRHSEVVIGGGEGEADVLAATVTAFFDVASTAHYNSMFEWRAQHLEGERALQAAYTAAVKQRTGSFSTASREVRLAAIQAVVLFARDAASARFYDQILDPIFVKYALTDSWLAQGYDAWPGQPRGFESYLHKAPGDR